MNGFWVNGIWGSDPGDEDDGFPVCCSCDRAHFQTNEDNLCPTCDMVLRAQAKVGLEHLQGYLWKVTLFERYLVEQAA